MKLFLDTYALIEISEGNDTFKKYLDSEAVTLKDNLAELYYYLFRKYGEEYADKSHSFFSKISKDLDNAIIPPAMRFRYKEKNKHFSYIDCLGYTYAIKNDLVFLTGDRSFAKFNGVEIAR